MPDFGLQLRCDILDIRCIDFLCHRNSLNLLTDFALRNTVSKQLVVPRLSVSVVWQFIEECPRARKGEQHDAECFKPAVRKEKNCPAAVLTTLSILWVQSLRKSLLMHTPRPEYGSFPSSARVSHNVKLGTRAIRARLFRSPDLLFTPQLASVERFARGPHFGPARLLPACPDTTPTMKPYLGWKTLADKGPSRGESLLQMLSEQTTVNAFEAIGGSERTATNVEVWNLLNFRYRETLLGGMNQDIVELVRRALPQED